MERLLDRLRTLSHPGERPRHLLDLRAPIGEAVEALRPAFNEKNVVVSSAPGPSPCMILGDHSELEQLFPILRTMQRRRGGDLSGGQQQQLAIARALVPRPRVLLLDEPTEGIQPSTIKEIARVLRVLLERRMTILLVEQYLDFALELAEHCVVLSRGEIVLRGRVADLDPAQVRKHLSI